MNRLTRFSLRWLLLVPFCLATMLPAYAADQDQNQWYNVELIVFAQRHPETGNEVWSANPGTPDLSTAQEIPTQAVPGAALQPLPPDQYQLQADEQKLTENGNYEVLLHTGWRQLGVPREKGIPVHIHTALPAASDTAPAAGDAAATATPAPTAMPRLDGVVELTVLRYLHLDVDLLFRGPPTTPSTNSDNSTGGFFGIAPPKPQVQIYRLSESRRMRSGELHYFDHPMFGVLALVTPYNPPAAAPATPTTPGAAAAPAASATPASPAPVPASGGNTGTIQRN